MTAIWYTVPRFSTIFSERRLFAGNAFLRLYLPGTREGLVQEHHERREHIPGAHNSTYNSIVSTRTRTTMSY